MQTLSKIKSLILLSTVVFFSVSAFAQQSIGWKDYNFVKYTDAWLTSENAAGLSRFTLDNISQAEIGYQKSKGHFVNYHQSDDSFDAGANIESLYRFDPKIVFYGKVGYNVFEGKNMAGSAFINPERNPFDIVEYSYEYAGKKKRESYNLVGAVSYDVYQGLTLGAKIDFTAENYAKHKDLRHKNNTSDMLLTAGVAYQIGNLFEIGANYYFKRRVEGVEFKTYGVQDVKYYSLIDFGGFYGSKEDYDGGTFTDTEGSERPLLDVYHGASLQLGINFTDNIHLYNEFSYKNRDGQFGKRATSSIVFTEHRSDILSYKGKLNIRNEKTLHSVDFNLMREKLKNDKNIYKIEKEQGEYTQRVVYYDPLKVGEKQFYNVGASYTANLGIEDFNPTWVLKGAFDFFSRKQVAYIYPYYRSQSLRQAKIALSGDRNIVKDDNMFTVRLAFGYQWGGGNINKDGMIAEPEGVFDMPSSNDSYLVREYEYLTADQINGEVGFKYSRLFPKLGMKGYAALNYGMTKAFDVKTLTGDTFNRVNLTIGCTF